MNVTQTDVMRALDDVCDPELDRSIVELNFIRNVHVQMGTVRVSLRLPTYWCSPNFAYLMMDDIVGVLNKLTVGLRVEVEVADHESAETLNRAFRDKKPFNQAFPSAGSLDALRHTFKEKAFYARQKRALDVLQSLGTSLAMWVPGTWEEAEQAMAQYEGGVIWERYRQMAIYWGIAHQGHAPFVTSADGVVVTPEAWERHQHRLKLIVLNMESNAHVCRGLLSARYQDAFDPDLHLPMA